MEVKLEKAAAPKVALVVLWQATGWILYRGNGLVSRDP
jgi:hypothetical protein